MCCSVLLHVNLSQLLRFACWFVLLSLYLRILFFCLTMTGCLYISGERRTTVSYKRTLVWSTQNSESYSAFFILPDLRLLHIHMLYKLCTKLTGNTVPTFSIMHSHKFCCWRRKSTFHNEPVYLTGPKFVLLKANSADYPLKFS